METSTFISLIAVAISLFALVQSAQSQKLVLISNIKGELLDKANICNKFINPSTHFASNKNADISAVVTNIIYAKKLLEISYKNHYLLLLNYPQADFLDYFYCALHSSIIELIKNPLSFEDYDPYTSEHIKSQQLVCRRFLQTAINKNLSR